MAQIQVLDGGLQFAPIAPVDAATENLRQRLRASDAAAGVQQSFVQGVQHLTAAENQVVPILHLGEEQTVLTTLLLALLVGEERGRIGSASHFCTRSTICFGSRESASCCKTAGSAQLRKAFSSYRKRIPRFRICSASQWC